MKNHLIILGLLFFLIGCGNEPPIVDNVETDLLLYQAGNINIPEDQIYLSVYFILLDENGMDDIDRIKVIHTETEYAWDLPLQILKTPYIWEEKTYIGYPFLEFNQGKAVLTGEYVIEVTDKAGNSAQKVFYIEHEGLILDKPFEIPDIRYKVDVVNKNKELKITGGNYASCEIMLMNDPSVFNGGRKKFSSDAKIMLTQNDNEAMPAGSKISVRINQSENDGLIYFLTPLTLTDN